MLSLSLSLRYMLFLSQYMSHLNNIFSIKHERIKSKNVLPSYLSQE